MKAFWLTLTIIYIIINFYLIFGRPLYIDNTRDPKEVVIMIVTGAIILIGNFASAGAFKCI
jgi:hypothetical protein